MSSYVVNLLRAKDLLHVQFEFVNLTLDESDVANPFLKRTTGAPAFIVVRFPPQHIVEPAFNRGNTRLPPPPYASFISCPSRIAFKVPEMIGSIPFTVDSILGLIRNVPPVTSEQAPNPTPATFIEFPDRLLLVPEPNARLFHSLIPQPGMHSTSGIEWTEIWHARLGIDDPPHGTGRIHFRAVDNEKDRTDRFSPDESTIRQEIRKQIVTQSTPHRIASSQFILTALGSSAQLKSDWPASDLPTWEHEAVVGRDRFVRVVEQGFLFPFRHRASVLTITRRDINGGYARLEKESFLTPEEAEISYDEPQIQSFYNNQGREMPLKRIRIVPQPPIHLPNEGAPIQLKATAEDSSGNIINCDLFMLFLKQSYVVDSNKLNSAYNTYKNYNTVALLTPQRIALADDRSARGDTTLTVTQLKFDIKILSANDPVQPPFLPFMQSAKVSIPAIEQLLGSVGGSASGSVPAAQASLASGPPERILTLCDPYLKFGFSDDTRKQVFAKFDSHMPELRIPAERAGGLTAPKFDSMDGLDRIRGLVSGVDNLLQGNSIDVDRLIGDAKLLGAIPLKKIIDSSLDNVPVTESQKLFDRIEKPDVVATRPILTMVQTGADVEARFLWKPNIKSMDLPPPLVRISGPMTLIIKGRVRKSLGRAAGAAFSVDGATFEVDGKLDNFGLDFKAFNKDLLTVNFNQVAFKSGSGKKMEFKVNIQGVEFKSGLAFIEKISKLLPTNSLGDAPAIQPRPDGVVVHFGAAIPSFAIGVLSIENIALSSSISLPFVEKPAAVRFSLSERSKPFLVSVSMFGGTGYFALEVRTDTTIQVEAAIEFGGIVSINLLDIVRGAVYVFAGVFVSVDPSRNTVVSGHLRFGGYVDVAGLITVSIEFYIGLQYDGQILIGKGFFMISVKIIFFSISQSFEVSKRIKGFGDPPTDSLIGFDLAAVETRPPSFTDTMNELQWGLYCRAFS